MKGQERFHIPPPLNMFIKANIRFTYDGKSYNYINQFVSNYGIAGLKWSLVDPRTMIGDKTQVHIDTTSGDRLTLQCPGSFITERSTDASYLGIKFELSPEDTAKLGRAIELWGTIPTTHIRKYPRIPASSIISSMPLQSIINHQGDFISTQISNISPNGILLTTENPKAALIEPGTRFHAQLEPRGDFYMAINYEGLVCRITEERADPKKNMIRHLGVRFTRFDEGHKEAFIALLQDILLRIKIQHAAKEESSS